jgi:hypothetical protein
MTLTTIFYWRFILSVNCNSDGTSLRSFLFFIREVNMNALIGLR